MRIVEYVLFHSSDCNHCFKVNLCI